MVPQQRGMALKEDEVPYRMDAEPEAMVVEETMGQLLRDIPLPDA
jgi:hypothetical protein